MKVKCSLIRGADRLPVIQKGLFWLITYETGKRPCNQHKEPSQWILRRLPNPTGRINWAYTTSVEMLPKWFTKEWINPNREQLGEAGEIRLKRSRSMLPIHTKE